MYMDAFPIGHEKWFSGVQQGARVSLQRSNDIELPWLPLASVTEVSTFGNDNTEAVFSSSNYYVDTSSNDIWGRIILNTGSVYPSNLRLQNSVKIVYVAGYGASASDVPAGISQGILMVASWMYSTRGDCSDGSCLIDAGAFGALAPFRVIIL